jgi:hypothetical protein
VHLTFEATIDQSGKIQLANDARLPASRRALVIVLDDTPLPVVDETALLSEATLAVDWNRPEEDAAWAYLQNEK